MFHTNENENAEIWESLDRWRGIVHHMLRRGRPPLGITEEKYILIHRELLELVQPPSRDEQTASDQLRHGLQRAVRPWVNLDTLSTCEKRVLRLLEREVDDFRNKLMPYQHRRSRVALRIFAVTIALVIAAIMLGMFAADEAWATVFSDGVDQVWRSLQSVKARIWHGVLRSTTNERLIALAASIVILGMFFLRTPKAS